MKPAPAGEPKTMPQYFGDWFRPRPELGRHDRIDILVAGCGTGQNLVETARDFKGALVLAVDLSLASLCYAKRQALALGLTNIAFGEADILKLGGIGRTFDIVDAQRRAPSHGRPLGRLAGPALAVAARRLHAGRTLQQARPPGRRCGARPHCRARLRSNRTRHSTQPPGYLAACRQGSSHGALPSISTSSPSANAATCSSMCRSIK